MVFVLLVQMGWVTYTGPGAILSNDSKNWYMIVLILTLLDLVLMLVVNSIKGYLIALIKTSEIHVKRIYHLAYYDALTKLPNKSKLQDTFQHQAVTNAMVIQFSVEGLSTMNSIYGTHKTDGYLQELAKELLGRQHSEDHLARVSGNEFLWIMTGDSESTGLQRYRQLIGAMQEFERHQHTRLILSYISGYILVKEALSLAEILDRTAIAIEQAKLQGKTEPQPYNLESQQHFLEQERLKVALAKAIRERQFTIFYQEKKDTKHHRTLGVEALARWSEEGLGFISPGVFIPLLKKINATLEFDLMITELVFSEFSRLQSKYHPNITVSINISPLSLITQSFIDQVIALSEVYSTPPRSIYFELTEDAFFESFEEANLGIEQLRAQGFKIAIDDFGSGYTAISYIFKLQFDELKMDRSFVQQLATSDVNHAILKTLISLRDTYQYAIVAEGVETQSECDLLQAMDCWQVQGYLFSKPMPCEENEVQDESQSHTVIR